MKVASEAWLTAVLRWLPDYRSDYLDLLPGMLALLERLGAVPRTLKPNPPSI